MFRILIKKVSASPNQATPATQQMGILYIRPHSIFSRLLYHTPSLSPTASHPSTQTLPIMMTNRNPTIELINNLGDISFQLPDTNDGWKAGVRGSRIPRTIKEVLPVLHVPYVTAPLQTLQIITRHFTSIFVEIPKYRDDGTVKRRRRDSTNAELAIVAIMSAESITTYTKPGCTSIHIVTCTLLATKMQLRSTGGFQEDPEHVSEMVPIEGTEPEIVLANPS